MNKQSTKHIFIYVSLCVAVIDLLFVYMNIHFSERSFKQTMKAESQNLYLNYQTLISQSYSNLLTIATFVANDAKVKHLFNQGRLAVEREGGGPGGEDAQRYRDALYALVGEKWQAVQEKFSARQLHFHLGPGSTSFLRVHRPEKFGDNMDNVRFTIVAANREGVPVSGFETGRIYSGLRGVVPVTIFDPQAQQNIHIGALEVGTSFNVILEILHETSNFSAGVLLSKSHIQSAMWPAAIEKKFGEQRINCGCVIEAASDDNFKELIEAGRQKGVVFREGGQEVVEVGGASYLISYYPLRDFLGQQDLTREEVGAVVFWKNVDQPLRDLRMGHFYNVLYGIGGFFLVELLFICAFRYGTRRLERVINLRTEELQVHQERLADAQEIALVGNWEWSIKTGHLWWSDQVYKLFRLNPNKTQPTYELFVSHIHPDDQKRVQYEMNKALSAKGAYAGEHRIVLDNGEERQVLEHAHIELDDSGQPALMKGTVQDITALKNVERRLADVIWATGVGIWEWQCKEDSLIVNERWADLAGYSLAELSPLKFASWEMLIHPSDLEQLRDSIAELQQSPETTIHTELRLRHRDGHQVWVLVRGRCVERDQNGEVIRISGSCSDITVRKLNELKIQNMATTDNLTGLFNRAVFNERLNEMVTSSLQSETPFCLMMIDLDGFKPINDKYGHPVGDQILKQVAADLLVCCRQSDVVARLGGDEFALLLPALTDKTSVLSFAQRILEMLPRERLVDGHNIIVQASIGCCIYHEAIGSAEMLIKKTDSALYEAKHQGKNRVQLYREG